MYVEINAYILGCSVCVCLCVRVCFRPLSSRPEMCGWLMKRWRTWLPPPKRSVPSGCSPTLTATRHWPSPRPHCDACVSPPGRSLSWSTAARVNIKWCWVFFDLFVSKNVLSGIWYVCVCVCLVLITLKFCLRVKICCVCDVCVLFSPFVSCLSDLVCSLHRAATQDNEEGNWAQVRSLIR